MEQRWQLYFAGICAMQFHPKNNLQNATPDEISTTIQFCAGIATKMCLEEDRRKEYAKWHGSEQ